MLLNLYLAYAKSRGKVNNMDRIRDAMGCWRQSAFQINSRILFFLHGGQIVLSSDQKYIFINWQAYHQEAWDNDGCQSGLLEKCREAIKKFFIDQFSLLYHSYSYNSGNLDYYNIHWQYRTWLFADYLLPMTSALQQDLAERFCPCSFN